MDDAGRNRNVGIDGGGVERVEQQAPDTAVARCSPPPRIPTGTARRASWSIWSGPSDRAGWTRSSSNPSGPWSVAVSPNTPPPGSCSPERPPLLLTAHLTFESARRFSVVEVDGLTVAELASRSGVPASTVRYYEQEGLLPARRSPAGYRLYDDADLDRLAFIGAAKSLGLALSEVRRLLEPWQHGQCSDVQQTLVPLVERRLAETRDRVRELTGFAERLISARAQLEEIERDGPCDPSCAFLGRAESVVGPVLGTLPPAEVSGEDPIACSLSGADRAGRVEQWREILTAVTERVAIAGGVRLTFDPRRLRLGALADLAESEVTCCGFFELTLHVGPPARLDARAPDDALTLVHELFGEPAA